MKKITFSNKIRVAAICAGIVFPAMAWADSAQLAADAFVNPGDPNNYGALPTVNVGGSLGAKGLVFFDLSTLTGTNVAWARLKIYVGTVATPGAIDLGAASALWTESTVSGVSGVGVGSPISTAAIASTGYVTFDVTAQVQAWLSGGQNNGFIFTPDSGTPGVAVYFDSKESASTSHPATLEVVFAGAAGATGPMGPLGTTGAAGSPGAPGLPGPLGPTGASGFAGPAGVAGPTGATGPVGAAGAAGNPGPAGPTGAVGTTGATGPVGAVGAAGASGATGAPGLAGAIGPTGAAGPQGSPGPAGATGPNFSNTLSVDATTHSGTYTIPDNATSVTFTTEGNTITLPLASSLTGKKIWIVPTNPSGSMFTIQRQGSDLIFWSEISTPTSIGLISIQNSNPVQLFSDGASSWFVTYIGH